MLSTASAVCTQREDVFLAWLPLVSTVCEGYSFTKHREDFLFFLTALWFPLYAKGVSSLFVRDVASSICYVNSSSAPLRDHLWSPPVPLLHVLPPEHRYSFLACP